MHAKQVLTSVLCSRPLRSGQGVFRNPATIGGERQNTKIVSVENVTEYLAGMNRRNKCSHALCPSQQEDTLPSRPQPEFRHRVIVTGIPWVNRGINMPQESAHTTLPYKNDGEGGKSLRELIRYPILLPVSVQRCPTRDGRGCFLRQQPSF